MSSSISSNPLLAGRCAAAGVPAVWVLLRGWLRWGGGDWLKPSSMFDAARQRDQANSGSSNPFSTTFTLQLMALITIGIGLTNLFPIPAVDGGRILFILPELLFRKRIPPKYENLVHTLGFVFLLAIMFYVTAQDIINPIQIGRAHV